MLQAFDALVRAQMHTNSMRRTLEGATKCHKYYSWVELISRPRRVKSSATEVSRRPIVALSFLLGTAAKTAWQGGGTGRGHGS